MSGAEHRNRLSSVARMLLAEHIRYAIGNLRGGLPFTNRGQAVGAGRIGRMPGTGCVDDGVGADNLGPLSVLVADLERRRLAALALQLVEAGAADAGDAAARLNVLGEGCLAGQRLAVA